MNICVQIVLCFSVYVSLYRIYSDSQVSTSSFCHNESVDDVNETIELDHNVEGMEEVPNLPRDILETFNRENEGSKPNIEETEVINLVDEGKTKNLVKIKVNFPEDMKDELIALLKEFDIVFVTSKAIKGQAIADYLVDQPLNDLEFSESLFPNADVFAIKLEPSNVKPWRWKLYFDGAAKSIENGEATVLVSPKRSTNPCFGQAEFRLLQQHHKA